MRIIKKRIDDLLLSDYNPRKDLKPGDKEYDDIKNSIEKFGYVQPIIINQQNNMIVGGNQRLKVLKELGYEDIECVIVDLDENNEKALNVALNKIDGTWDDEKLKELMHDLKETKFDMKFTGFNTTELDDMLKNFESSSSNGRASDDGFSEEKAIEEIGDNVKTKPGNLYQLGKHWLLCGDCFKQADRDKLINNNNFDILFTYPPYNMKFGGQGECFASSTKNLKKRIDKIIDFNVNQLIFLPELNIKSFYIFTSKDGIKDYFKIFDKYNFNILVWCKTNPTPFTAGTFLPDVEYLLYFSDKDKIWNNSLKPTEVYKKYYISKKEEGRNEDGDLHPTMKPLELISNRLRISSKEGGNILDLFGGSGSTMIASEQINRKCFVMEVEPIYCDVIINRYIKLKGSSDDVFLIKGKKNIPWVKYIEE